MMKQTAIFKLLFLFALLSISFAEGPDFTFYHSTDEIYNKIAFWKDNCNNMLTIKTINEKPLIHLLDINKANKREGKKHKAFVLFGEHAREMISPEAGLSLVERICNNEVEKNDVITTLLQKYHFQIILNANPSSRIKVENGDYCLRVNENGVDLNRNWDSHWEKSGDIFSQTNSGERPFSEVETQAIKNSLVEFNPKVFLTIHSGAMGMYTPYAYSDEKGVFNENRMMNVLSELNPKHCNCNAGSAGREVGYLCPGTCLDYAYDNMKVPYVFAWEIYQRDFDYRKLEAEQKLKFLQVNRKAKQVESNQNHAKNALFSCFVQTSMSSMNGLSSDECFDYFNPTTQEKYNFVVRNWVDAMIEMFVSVDKQEMTR